MAPILLPDRNHHVLVGVLSRTLCSFPGEAGAQDGMAAREVLPGVTESALAHVFAPITNQLRNVDARFVGRKAVEQHSLLERRERIRDWVRLPVDFHSVQRTISSRTALLLPDPFRWWTQSSASIVSARPATVGRAKSSRNGTSTPEAIRKPDIRRAAISEWPPRSKKLSETPKSERLSTLRKMASTVSSVG